MELPTINISPKVRFILYLFGVLGAVLVQYAIDKAWFGEAEMRLWSGVAAVLFALAAAKTNLSPTATVVQGTVISQTGETGTIDATLSEATAADLTASEGDDGLSYEEAGGRPYAGENYNEGEDYGTAPNPRDYPRTYEDGDPNR
jgi:hypothetical protein